MALLARHRKDPGGGERWFEALVDEIRADGVVPLSDEEPRLSTQHRLNQHSYGYHLPVRFEASWASRQDWRW